MRLTIIAAQELDRYGVRCNAIAPGAATRITATVPGIEERWSEEQGATWVPHDAANVSPFVAYLATEECPINGRVFYVMGGTVALFQPFALVDSIDVDRRWTADELSVEAARFSKVEFDLNEPA